MTVMTMVLYSFSFTYLSILINRNRDENHRHLRHQRQCYLSITWKPKGTFESPTTATGQGASALL
jgi:hypothetical protein